MEFKRLKVLIIILIIGGGVILTSVISSMVDYTLDSWPPYSKKGFAFIGYTAVIETIILLIIIPILYLLIIRKEKAPKKILNIQEKEPEKIGYCKSCGAEIIDKTGDFCSKCGAPLK